MTTKAARTNKPVTASDGLFDLASFLAVSARGTLEEGVYCGSLRLIDAIRKTIRAFPNAIGDTFLSETLAFIDSHFEKDYLESEEKYVAFLDDIVTRFAKEILQRNNVSTRPQRHDSQLKEICAGDVMWEPEDC